MTELISVSSPKLGASNFAEGHVPTTGKPFAELTARVRAAGLLEPRTRFYAWKLVFNTTLIAIGFVAFFLLGNSWWQLAVALWMALCGGQCAFMWHDAGHKAMFANKRLATWIGRLHANLFNGVCYEWWVGHHNRHHSFPNHLENDPDIGRRTVIFRIDQYASRSRWGRFVARHQGVLFFVLLVFEVVKLHKTAYKSIRSGTLRSPWTEGGLLALYAVVYLGLVFTVLDPIKAIVFVAVQQAALGVYFGLMFAPNHKGMPVRDVENLDWLNRQVLTSRNIKSNWFISFLYGGLNYQIEHHLYPAMPLVNLGRCRPIVKQYCEENDIPYYETGIVRSYAEVAGFLTSVTKGVRA